LILAICNQRIRDIAESALDGLLVGQDHQRREIRVNEEVSLPLPAAKFLTPLPP